jgi:hypothetical protein
MKALFKSGTCFSSAIANSICAIDVLVLLNCHNILSGFFGTHFSGRAFDPKFNRTGGLFIGLYSKTSVSYRYEAFEQYFVANVKKSIPQETNQDKRFGQESTIGKAKKWNPRMRSGIRLELRKGCSHIAFNH